ncbi:MAG: peptide chain release factor 3 [Actinomycetota bacterium]|jgi:peptide chain release factor 3|nr:peptide chain release factor 3 [Actinomycetota bacterium]
MTVLTQTSNPAVDPTAQAARRRTFAIISHPDAGKTTLTEKFLLYAGAVSEAGAVKARAGRRRATSDWMAMEQQRGISITSTVLQFTYRDCVLNLLDTPGHRDFSEDTYRVLAAADAAVMVLDAAKGVEAQTLKLFEVCRTRRIPVLTFLNKYDRPGREPLELLDEIEDQIGLRSTPVTWPVGIPGDFRGVIDRRDDTFVRFARTARGATAAPEEIVSPSQGQIEEGGAWEQAMEEVALLDAVGADLDPGSFLAGETSPLFVGSALTNFGVRHLLDAIVDLAPRPSARADTAGRIRALDDPFSGFVFKVQANMDPAHRDHVAFVRVCSGRFERGMTVTHAATGRPFSTKYATSVFGSERDTIDEAYPGDVIGLVNASDLRIGDTLHQGEPVAFPAIPAFEPELFATARARDTSRSKQFRRGLDQLEQEGVIQVLHDPDGDPTPTLAAVGQMQFEVFAHRLQHEYDTTVDLSTARQRIARRTDPATADQLRAAGGTRILARADGTLLALFDSPYWLQRLEADHPDWHLEPVLTHKSPS